MADCYPSVFPVRAPLERSCRLPVLLGLALGAALLGSCANGDFDPSYTKARIKPHEYKAPAAMAGVPLEVLPFGSAVKSALTFGESDKRILAESIYVYEVDRAKQLITEETGIDPGTYLLGVKYCRHAPAPTECSETVELSFRADPKVHYKLWRGQDLRIGLSSQDTGLTVARSEKKAAVSHDHQRCLKWLQARVDEEIRAGRAKRSETDKLRAEAENRCNDFVWGTAETAE